MNKSAFIKRFLEIYVNTTLPHPDDAYTHIDFDVMISPKCNDRSCIAVFSGGNPP